MTSTPKRPRDPNQLAKLIVDIAAGDVLEHAEDAAPKRGSAGGKVGGAARAANLSPEQRSEAARKAVQSRWARRG